MEPKNRERLAIGIFVFFVVAIIAVSVVNIVWNKINSVTVDLLMAPTDSEVLMNGKRVGAGTFKVAPGEYEFVVAHAGFESQTKKVVFEADETKRVYFVLVSNDESTADWYETHPEDAEILEGVSSWAYDDGMDSISSDSIVNDLPVYAAGYTLGYGDCGDNEEPMFCIVIKADFGFRDLAIKYLQGTGKDMAEYYIKITNYKSPFSDFTVTVPDNLSFSGNTNADFAQGDLPAIRAVAEARNANLRSSEYDASVMQIKNFGGNYCAVKVKVSDGEDGSLQDTYRMILAKVDGEWRVVSNIDFLLSYDANPKLPKELVQLTNEF